MNYRNHDCLSVRYHRCIYSAYWKPFVYFTELHLWRWRNMRILPWRPGLPSTPSSPCSPFSPGGPGGPAGPLMGSFSSLACSGWPCGDRQLRSIVQTPSSLSTRDDWSLWRCFLLPPLRSAFLSGDLACDDSVDVTCRYSKTIRRTIRLQHQCIVWPIVGYSIRLSHVTITAARRLRSTVASKMFHWISMGAGLLHRSCLHVHKLMQ